MIEMKEKLKTEIESSRRREKTIEGMAPRATSIIRKIYQELAKSGDDGEKLASAFRKVASRQGVVSALQRARKRGNLIEKARELLLREENAPVSKLEKEKEVKLTRVCWCWIQP